MRRPDAGDDAARRDALEAQLDVRAFADTAPAVLWVTDPSGCCTFLSRAWYELTGQTEETALGYGWTDAVHPDDREKSTAIFLAANAKREAFELDYRLRDAQGRYRRAIDAGRPRFGPDGTFLGFVGSVIDITERHELEEQLRHAQKMEAVGRLAGGIAHDFNNLLTIIRGYASVLLERLAPGSDGTHELTEISTAADRAADLTQQLLAIGRHQALRPIVVDLNTTVRQADSLLRRLVEEHIAIDLDLSAMLIPVRLDRGQLVQVLLNLVANARDAMPQGGVLTLTTSRVAGDAAGILPPGDYARLSVIDTGTGIADDVRPHIFEPFFTTKDVGQGTGLGLATVYAIVKQSNGHVDIESTPGRGTAFHVYLPVVAEAPAAVDAPPPAMTSGSETVLLVEDEPAVRHLIARVLRDAGYRVIEAVDGPAALDIAANNPAPVHLLLTDVMMPGLSGPEIAERVRRIRPEIRVLFVSGYAGEVTRTIAGAPPLQKPFAKTALLERVRQALR